MAEVLTAVLGGVGVGGVGGGADVRQGATGPTPVCSADPSCAPPSCARPAARSDS